MKKFLWNLSMCFISTLVTSQSCSERYYFGPSCQYWCHCKYSCDSNGNCLGSSGECMMGWFGHRCQYRDVAVLDVVHEKKVISLRTDPCNSNITIGGQPLTFTWKDYQPFTWIRIKILPGKNLKRFSLTFINEFLGNFTCINQRMFQLDVTTFDIYCDLNVAVNQLTLAGEAVDSMCSVHISGGRNFALKQRTTQSSTHLSEGMHGADKAVDGFVRDSCGLGRCSHTNITDSNPYWTVMFNKQYRINRFNLHNRRDSSQWRLKYFNLQVVDSQNTTIFNYTDENNDTKLYYTVLYLNDNLVSGVRVSQININHKKDKNPFMSLNEFEAFGECEPGMWGLNCDNQCDSPCRDQCVTDDGSCNIVCGGFASPTCYMAGHPQEINMKVFMSCPLPRSCKDVNSTEDRVVVTLASGIKVMCDTKTDGGGWIIFQRRINGKVDFYRGWEEYRFGFGNYTVGEFYLGNENIYQLTTRRQHQLRIDLEFNKARYFALYSLFRLLGENENYRLKISGYSGNAIDSLIFPHNNKMFSTFDRDNDNSSSSNCAVAYHGAWWYSSCHASNLNGMWGSSKMGEGVIWHDLTGKTASATFTEMKIREID